MQPTERSKVRRLKERGVYDRDVIHRILDAGLVCHVGFVADGQPFVIPMGYARLGDEILLHGSVASRLLGQLGEGAAVCVTVTHLDGIVVARSGFHSSMNYRSAVVFGRPRRITDPEEKRRALDALVEHLIPGRTADARPSTTKEIAATEVVAVPIEDASAKVRTGPPKEPDEDVALDVWAGVVPVRLAAGEPEPAPNLRPAIPVPAYLRPHGAFLP